MRFWSALWLVLGCGGRDASETEPARPAPAIADAATSVRATPDAAPKPTARPLSITWQNVRTANSSCFYFSGPEGRDDKLVGQVTVVNRAELGDGPITIAINGVRFEGTYQDRTLAVKRITEHSFGGPWTATEEIKGTFVDATLVGTYTYRECEHGQPCPGNCTIDADIRFER